MINTGIANTAAVALPAPPLTIEFHITNASAIPTARMISCTSETLSGPIWKFILNHPFGIFLGTNTFMNMRYRNN